MTAREAAQLMKQLDQAAFELGDNTLMNRINNYADALQKDIQSGVDVGELEGLPFMTRKTKNGEQTLTIKQTRAVFAKEDDDYLKQRSEIEAIPNAVERTVKLSQLYAAYLYGSPPSDTDPTGWTGLKNRTEIMGQWSQLIPENQATYENNIRDNERKFEGLNEVFKQTVVQLQSYDPALLDQATANGVPLSQLLSQVGTTLPQTTYGNEYGVLISYDKLGQPYEKLVRLNADLQETGPGGEVMNLSTYVGKNIAKTPDGKYVKLIPVGADPQYPDFYTAQYNGELYIQEPFSTEMKLARDVAAADAEDGARKSWYEANKQFDIVKLPEAPDFQNADLESQGFANATLPEKPKFPELPQSPIAPSPAQPISDFTPKKDIGMGSYQLPYGQVTPSFDYQPTASYNSGSSSYYSPYELPTSNYTNPYTYQLDSKPQDTLYNAGTTTFGQPNPAPNITPEKVGQLNISNPNPIPQVPQSFGEKVSEKVVGGVKSLLNWLNPFK
jgi:hypothetical protein